jgi:hypothetical protein
MQTTTNEATAAADESRLFAIIGILLGVGSLIACAIQFSQQVLIVPWYVPIFWTTGAIMMLWALILRRTVRRYVGLAACVLITALTWLGMSYFRLPAYAGPVTVDQPFPAFSTITADGTTFSETNLSGPKNTAMVFFRGRW